LLRKILIVRSALFTSASTNNAAVVLSARSLFCSPDSRTSSALETKTNKLIAMNKFATIASFHGKPLNISTSPPIRLKPNATLRSTSTPGIFRAIRDEFKSRIGQKDQIRVNHFDVRSPLGQLGSGRGPSILLQREHRRLRELSPPPAACRGGGQGRATQSACGRSR
jgi:hypothetical protein